MDIKPPPKRPLPPPPRPTGVRSQAAVPSVKSAPSPKSTPSQLPPEKQYGLQAPKRRRRWPWVVGALIVIVLGAIIAAVSGYSWYQQQLTPRDPQNTKMVRVVVEGGSTVADIAADLEAKKLIRSAFAFELYAREHNNLKAGGYAFNPAMSVADIIQHLEEGRFDEFRVTILPGWTIWDIQDNLIKTGFTKAEVEKALKAKYDHPLLAAKPATASLEGYIYPETYQLTGDATVSQLFEKTFDEFYKQLQEKQLLDKFKKRNLSLHQALTLGSIIQKEVAEPADQRQVAQVFYKRLAENIPLGADATFIYGAKVLGVEPRVSLDSPYNTRIHTGLPPGPISSVGLSALEAVADPAPGDYLYFVSGDDGHTHFTRTLEEHEEATRKYCRENCDIFQN